MPPTPIPSTTLLNTASAPGAVAADPPGATVDATNGNTFANSGMTLIRVQNTDGAAAHTLTIIPAETVAGLTLQNDQRIIPAGSTAWIARLNPAVYGSAVQVTGPATLKLTVFEP